jgi:hypothetical protein
MKLSAVPMTLAAYTARTEKQGNGPDESAASLTLETSISDETLPQFFASEEAWKAFSKACWDESGNPRHGIKKVELDRELIGGIATLTTPQSKKPIELSKMDIKALRLELLEGHSANVKIRLNCHPTEQQAGLLSVSWLGKEVLVTAERSLADVEREKAQGDLGLTTKRKDTIEEQDEAPDSSKTIDQQQADAAAPVGQKPPQRAKKARETVQ